MELTKEKEISIILKIKQDTKKELNKILNVMRKHRFLSLAILSFLIFSTINFIMIYQFMKILQNL